MIILRIIAIANHITALIVPGIGRTRSGTGLTSTQLFVNEHVRTQAVEFKV